MNIVRMAVPLYHPWPLGPWYPISCGLQQDSLEYEEHLLQLSERPMLAHFDEGDMVEEWEEDEEGAEGEVDFGTVWW